MNSPRYWRLTLRALAYEGSYCLSDIDLERLFDFMQELWGYGHVVLLDVTHSQ